MGGTTQPHAGASAPSTTVLITDMEGSTAEMEGRGDTIGMEVIRTHERLVRDVVTAHGGREIKSMGDGFMIAFETPAKGIACALDVQQALQAHNAEHPDQPIRVRMGMNAGPVIEEGGDLYGTTVNAASRIAAKARSGQVLVSEAVREGSGAVGDWTFVDRGLYWLKGLRERWTLHEVTRGPSAVHPAALEGLTPFVDREEERASLRSYVDAAIDGRGALVLLVGEAGAGKTRLAEEIGLEGSGRGMRLLTGRCYEASRNDPFTPFIDVLQAVERSVSAESFRAILGEAAGEIARILPRVRHLYPDIPAPADLPDADQARRYLFASVRDVLVGMALQRPLYLILDDIHWADEPSLLFLEQLAHELASVPILIIGTYIQAELSASRPLQSLVEDLHRRRLVERFQIGPFAEHDLGTLLEALAGTTVPTALIRLLYDETEGNIFFAEEVFRHLIEQGRVFDAGGNWRRDLDSIDLDLPDTIRLTIGRRLEGLADSTRRILTTAAVIGRAFGFDLLERLSDATDEELIDALDEAERARVIASTSEGGAVQFRFSHELIRQTLAANVSLTRRQLVHHRIAEAIENVYAASLGDHAAAIAYHLEQAGRRADPAKTAHFHTIAGERALEAAAYEEASRHFDAALSRIPSDDPLQRAPVLEKLGAAVRSLGTAEEAIAVWGEALDAYEAVGDEDAVAQLCLRAAQLAPGLRRRAVAELIERGLAALGNRRTPTRAGLLALSGSTASAQGQFANAEHLLEEALAVARETNDRDALGLVLYSRALHHYAYSQYPETVLYGKESVEHLRGTSDLWTLAQALAYVANASSITGDFDHGVEVGKEGEALSRKVGNWSAWAFADRAIVTAEFGRNPDLDWYEQDGRRGLALAAEQGFAWMTPIGHVRLGLADFWKGRWDEALARFAEAASSEGARAFPDYTARLFLTHAYVGNAAEALRLVEGSRTAFPTPGQPNIRSLWTVALMAIETYALVGADDNAAALYSTATEAIAAGGLLRGLDYRVLQTDAGIAAACGEMWDEAEHHFEEALRLTRELPIRLEEPEACYFYARMLGTRQRPGDGDRARELSGRAIKLYGQIGMRRHEELARQLLAQIA